MNLNEIKELLLVIDKTNLENVKLESDGFKLEVLKNANNIEVGTEKIIINSYPDEIVNSTPSYNIENASTIEDDLHLVTSPLMGTFYQAPSPDAEDFVKVGDIVEKGDILCIVEAMKLMNEINSEIRGKVVEINANNEDLIEYNQPLFKIKPL